MISFGPHMIPMQKRVDILSLSADEEIQVERGYIYRSQKWWIRMMLSPDFTNTELSFHLRNGSTLSTATLKNHWEQTSNSSWLSRHIIHFSDPLRCSLIVSSLIIVPLNMFFFFSFFALFLHQTYENTSTHSATLWAQSSLTSGKTNSYKNERLKQGWFSEY